MVQSFGSEILITAIVLLAITLTPAFAQVPPQKVLERFCELDAKGNQLNAAGSHEIGTLFTHPIEPVRDKVIIIRDFVVLAPSTKGDGRQFEVEYIYLGQLDLSRARDSHLTGPYPLGLSRCGRALS